MIIPNLPAEPPLTQVIPWPVCHCNTLKEWTGTFTMSRVVS